MAKHNDLGKKAEEFAARYLHSIGYKVIHQNWKSGKLEIDIIAKTPGITAIVEVKFRSGDWNGSPEQAVNPAKIKHLVQAANVYADKTKNVGQIRFDIIAVRLENDRFVLEHLEDAFYYF